MSTPKPIVVTTLSTAWLKNIQIEVIGYKTRLSKPYLTLSTSDETIYGYIEDRDIKRLKAWCEDCLKERK